MLEVPLKLMHGSVLSDLRRQVMPATFDGFELLADEPFLGDLRSTLGDPVWLPFRRFLARHITGFAAFKFAWFYSGQGASSWVFLDESKPVPAPRVLLRLALWRAVVLRYERLGVRSTVLNRRVREAHATRFTDRLLQRRLPHA
jgi:hypothetical protein